VHRQISRRRICGEQLGEGIPNMAVIRDRPIQIAKDFRPLCWISVSCMWPKIWAAKRPAGAISVSPWLRASGVNQSAP